MYYNHPTFVQNGAHVPPSPAAGSLEARQMAIAAWRRQQEDALRQIEAAKGRLHQNPPRLSQGLQKICAS